MLFDVHHLGRLPHGFRLSEGEHPGILHHHRVEPLQLIHEGLLKITKLLGSAILREHARKGRGHLRHEGHLQGAVGGVVGHKGEIRNHRRGSHGREGHIHTHILLHVGKAGESKGHALLPLLHEVLGRTEGLRHIEGGEKHILGVERLGGLMIGGLLPGQVDLKLVHQIWALVTALGVLRQMFILGWLISFNTLITGWERPYNRSRLLLQISTARRLVTILPKWTWSFPFLPTYTTIGRYGRGLRNFSTFNQVFLLLDYAFCLLQPYNMLPYKLHLILLERFRPKVYATVLHSLKYRLCWALPST